MTINKKQAEFQVNARIVAVSTDQALTSGNVSALLDSVALNGKVIASSALDATGKANVAAALKVLFDVFNGL